MKEKENEKEGERERKKITKQTTESCLLMCIYSRKSYINSQIDLLNGNISRALKEEKD